VELLLPAKAMVLQRCWDSTTKTGCGACVVVVDVQCYSGLPANDDVAWQPATA
jgi:hypothetical protein